MTNQFLKIEKGDLLLIDEEPHIVTAVTTWHEHEEADDEWQQSRRINTYDMVKMEDAWFVNAVNRFTGEETYLYEAEYEADSVKKIA